MTAAAHDDSEETVAQQKLLRDLDRLTGARCAGCSRRLCGHEALFSLAAGFKDAPRCLACLAGALGRTPDELREYLARYVRRRDCFRRGWEVASEREGSCPAERPACLWPAAGDEGMQTAELEFSGPAGTAVPAPAGAWDAGDMGCGDLVLALRGRLNTLPPGAVLKVTARDPAAPLDLPAWCRLTGHRLLRAAHPEYHIQRKEP
jgi:tRNA 2-thiouridine synthesizing protein A